MNRAILTGRFANGFSQLGQEVRTRFVVYGMHGVESQSVNAIFLDPVERVVNEIVAHWATLRAIKVDGLPPGSPVAISEILWRIQVKVVSFRSEVVVDNIQEDH